MKNKELPADLGDNLPGVSLVIEGDGQVTLGASQHLSMLEVEAGASVDVRDHFLAIDYDGSSPSLPRDRFLSSAPPPGAFMTVAMAESGRALGISATQTGLWRNEMIDASTLLIAHTFAGDANVDGRIDADDYFLIDSGYGSGASGFAGGDFNADGGVDGEDYFLIDSNYGIAPSAAAWEGSVYRRLVAKDETLVQ